MILKCRNCGTLKKKQQKFTGLTHNQTVLEIGTGTGELTIEIARYCTKVFAADVSPTMLQFARQKARDRDVNNVEFHDGGFLTYMHAGEPLDIIISQLALHHLPGFWKLIALKRINSISVVGKPNIYRPNDGGCYVSIRPEDIHVVTAQVVETWTAETAKRTLERIKILKEAMTSGKCTEEMKAVIAAYDPKIDDLKRMARQR